MGKLGRNIEVNKLYIKPRYSNKTTGGYNYFNRLFIFCIVLIIFQYAVFIPHTSSQVEITPDQEFDILLKEVLSGFISFNLPIEKVVGKTLEEIKRIQIINEITGNAKRILYGEALVPEDVLDTMDFSLEWWNYSQIYGIMSRNPIQGREYLYRLIHAVASAIHPTSLPPKPLDLFRPISREPRDDIKIKTIIEPPPLTNILQIILEQYRIGNLYYNRAQDKKEIGDYENYIRNFGKACESYLEVWNMAIHFQETEEYMTISEKYPSTAKYLWSIVKASLLQAAFIANEINNPKYLEKTILALKYFIESINFRSDIPHLLTVTGEEILGALDYLAKGYQKFNQQSDKLSEFYRKHLWRFERQLEKDPNSEYAPLWQYQVGELHFILKDFESACESYLEVLKIADYPPKRHLETEPKIIAENLQYVKNLWSVVKTSLLQAAYIANRIEKLDYLETIVPALEYFRDSIRDSKYDSDYSITEKEIQKARLYLGLGYFKLGKYEKAMREFEWFITQFR